MSGLISESLYAAFGLHWESPDLPLPELPAVDPAALQTASGSARVVVQRQASSSWPPLVPGPDSTPFLQVAPGDLRLQVEEIARFRIHAGEQIAFDPWHGEGNEQDLRTFLLGSAVGALLIQRGMLVLHGNALERNGRAIVCMGHSGAGKSTLAYALMQQGWRLLADDLVGVTPTGWVLPGIPRIKLWHDAAVAFGLDPEVLPPIRQGMLKYLLMGDAVQRAPDPVPLQALYLIDQERHASGDLPASRLTRITSQKEAALRLRNQAYRPRFVRGLGLEGANFVALAALQQRVPLALLPLPAGIRAMQDWLEPLDLLVAAAEAEGANQDTAAESGARQ